MIYALCPKAHGELTRQSKTEPFEKRMYAWRMAAQNSMKKRSPRRLARIPKIAIASLSMASARGQRRPST